jgi:hypothetical protein
MSPLRSAISLTVSIEASWCYKTRRHQTKPSSGVFPSCSPAGRAFLPSISAPEGLGKPSEEIFAPHVLKQTLDANVGLQSHAL